MKKDVNVVKLNLCGVGDISKEQIESLGILKNYDLI